MLLRPIIYLMQMTGIPKLVFSLLMDKRVPLPVKAILPATLAYFIIPSDLLPDFVTPIGRIDDVVVLVIGTLAFLTLAPKSVVSEYTGRGRVDDDSDGDGEVVEGKYRYIDDKDKPSPENSERG